jgi:hypothetical protein
MLRFDAFFSLAWHGIHSLAIHASPFMGDGDSTVSDTFRWKGLAVRAAATRPRVFF